MKKSGSYVKFDVSEPPIGHEPDRSVYGFKAQPRDRDILPLVFKGSVGEIEGYGKSFEELFREDSLTAGEEIALFNVYLLEKKGLVKLTNPQKEYLNHKFDRVGYGNILETVADFDNGDKSMPKRKDPDRRILLIDRPELLVVEDGIIKEVRGGERKPKLWPGNGYVGRTCDGPYDSDGVPMETWSTRKQAEQTWLSAGADIDFAKDAVSYAWSRDESQGKAVLSRRFFARVSGRFCLDADGDPGTRLGVVGRSPVSR